MASERHISPTEGSGGRDAEGVAPSAGTVPEVTVGTGRRGRPPKAVARDTATLLLDAASGACAENGFDGLCHLDDLAAVPAHPTHLEARVTELVDVLRPGSGAKPPARRR